MPETLIVRLGEDAQVRDWITLDEQNQVSSDIRTGEPDRRLCQQAQYVVVLVPAEDVRLVEATVPVRNRQRVLQAIPYALEEQLAEDVEGLHFAVGPLQESGEYPVAVASRQRMEAWLATLDSLQLTADEMVSEIQALPIETGSWSMLVEGGRALVRSNSYAGFATDTTAVATLFELYAGQETAPQRVQVYGNTIIDLGVVDVEMDGGDLAPLQLMAWGWKQKTAINLLQGKYSQKEDLRQLLSPWRATAALLVAGLVLALVSVSVESYRLSKQQEMLSAQIEQLYKKTFPNAKRVVNARAQMEQQLKRLQLQSGTSQTDFIALLGETGNVIKRTKGVEINAASFRDGRLDLELSVDNLQILDKLKQELVASGRLEAEIQSATTEAGQKVKSRLRVKGV